MNQQVCLEESKTRSPLYRQYTITSYNDLLSVENGQCPSYSISWPRSQHKKYWPTGHDYYLGNGKYMNDNQELREILSKKLVESNFQLEPDNFTLDSCTLDACKEE